MGDDEAGLVRLWREGRGEVEPEDLSANLIVQPGVVTDHIRAHKPYLSFLTLGDFRRRTPGPPPFSSMNSTPAASRRPTYR